MEGFILGADQTLPVDAVAYAIPVFSTREQAEQLCAGFRPFGFDEWFTGTTPLSREVWGAPVAIVPFLWPVRDRTPNTLAGGMDCPEMARRYNMAAAAVARRRAANALIRYGVIKTADEIATAPLVVVFDRTADRVIVYDFSKIPQIDFPAEVAQMKRDVEGMRAAAAGFPAYFKADWRQELRFYAFQGEPALKELVYALAPGLKQG